MSNAGDSSVKAVSARTAWALLAVILAASAVLRFWTIGAKELWLDECISALAVERAPSEAYPGTHRPLTETVRNVAQHDAHPPLYYVLLNLCTRLTGRGEDGLRALSAVASIGCVALTYAIGAALLGRAAGLLAAGMLAVSSFQIYFAQEARLHALVTLLVLAMTFALLRLFAAREQAAGRGWLWAAAYGVLAAAALYTYYYAVFAMAAHAAAFLALAVGSRLQPQGQWLLDRRRADAVWPMLLAAGLAAVLLFLAGWASVIARRLGGLPGEVHACGPAEAAVALRQFLTGYVVDIAGPGLDRFTRATLLVVALLPFAGAACAARRLPGAVLVLALSVIGPFACAAVVPRPHVFEGKHLAFVAPFVFLMLAAGWSWGRARVPLLVVIALVAAANIGLNAVYFRPSVHKEPWRAVVRDLDTRGRMGDVVVVTPAYAAHALGRYYRGPLPLAAATGLEPLRRSPVVGAAARLWLVELDSRVASPDPGVVEWVMAGGKSVSGERRPGAAGVPDGSSGLPVRTFAGFSTFPTEIRVRCAAR